MVSETCRNEKCKFGFVMKKRAETAEDLGAIKLDVETPSLCECLISHAELLWKETRRNVDKKKKFFF